MMGKTSKKLVAFDLDGTLADSKSPVPPEIIEMLQRLLRGYEVAIISGGALVQFEQQLFSSNWNNKFNSRLHILPTCGAQYYIYTGGQWVPVYKENFTEAEAKKIMSYLDWVIEERNLDDLSIRGPQVENRGAQITFSALGQDAPLFEKLQYDPNGEERKAIKKILDFVLPEFEIRVGGSTSIDITKRGRDKAFGMRNLLEYLHLTPADAIFFGDKLQEGGNDYPVIATGIECIEVENWKDTLRKIEGEKL